MKRRIEERRSGAEVLDALVRGIKLVAAMNALGFGLAFVAWWHLQSPGLESGLWQGGALAAFLGLAGVLHGRYRAGENLLLAYLWAGSLAPWFMGIASFLIETHWPAVFGV